MLLLMLGAQLLGWTPEDGLMYGLLGGAVLTVCMFAFAHVHSRRRSTIGVPREMRRLLDEMSALDRSGAPDAAMDEAYQRLKQLSWQSPPEHYLALFVEAWPGAQGRYREKLSAFLKDHIGTGLGSRILQEIADRHDDPLSAPAKEILGAVK